MKRHRLRFLHKREFIIPAFCILLNTVMLLFAIRLQTLEGGLIRRGWLIFGEAGGLKKYLNCIARAILRAFYLQPTGTSSVLITFCAITASVVILFYSLFDAKNLGITHRLIMNYFVGSFTIPVSFVLQLGNLCIVYIMACEKKTVFACVMSIYVFIQQLFIILTIMISTSCNFNVRMILKQEEWQFKYRKKLNEKDVRVFDALKTHHAVCAIKCEDTFFDRMKLITRILMVPIRYFKRSGKKENKKDSTKWECADIYNYYIEQMVGIFSVLKNRKEERIKFYEILYEILKDIQSDGDLKKLREGPYAQKYEDIESVICSAFMNAAIICDLPEAEPFCNNILNEIFTDDEDRNKQMCFYFLICEMNRHLDENNVNTTFDLNFLREIKGFEHWELKDCDADSLFRFWHLMVDALVTDHARMERYYDDFINTYKKINSSSDLMEYLLACREKLDQ